MADEKKAKATRIITPKFIAMYAWLSTPNTKHDKDGTYTVSGIFDPKVPEHRAFLGQLKKLHTDNVNASRAVFKPKKKEPEMKVTPCMHEEEEGGKFRVNFKESAFIVVKDKATGADKRIDLKPPAVDAKGQPTDVEIWSGSTIKVAVDVAAFYNGSLGAGLSLRLKGVQVIELRTRGSRDGASLGFGVEEGFSGAEQEGDEDVANEFTDETDESPADVELEDAPDVPVKPIPATTGDEYDF